MPFPYTFPFFFETITPVVKVKVRIAFGSDPFDVAPVWTDVSADVKGFSYHRGRKHQLDRMEAGEARVLLDNAAGDYWPKNAGGAYYPNVLPVKKINIQVSADNGASYYDRFTGFITDWLPKFMDKGGKGPIMEVRAVEPVRNFAFFLITNADYAQELSGERIKNVLNDISWPALDRDIDDGQTLIIASGANLNAKSHFDKIQESEEGVLFTAPDGDIQFEDRHHRLKDPHLSAIAIFGDDSPESRYAGVEFSFDDQYIYGDTRVTRSGGAEQTASDAPSKTAYGHRSVSRTGLLMPTDAEALSQAEWLLREFKEPDMRVKSITIEPDKDHSNLYALILTLEISDRITVRLNQASIDEDYFIEGIEESFDPRVRLYRTKYEISPASLAVGWVLGEAGNSEIGDTTWLSY